MVENIKAAEETKEVVSRNFIEQEIDKDLAEGVYDHAGLRASVTVVSWRATSTPAACKKSRKAA